MGLFVPWRTGLEAGQGFWEDALIVVESEHKGHWNKWSLQLTEWALCSDSEVQRLWENLFFPFPEDINISVHEIHHGKHSRLVERNEDLFDQQLAVMVLTEILYI